MIGDNGNWWVGNDDTGVNAQGEDGATRMLVSMGTGLSVTLILVFRLRGLRESRDRKGTKAMGWKYIQGMRPLWASGLMARPFTEGAVGYPSNQYKVFIVIDCTKK